MKVSLRSELVPHHAFTHRVSLCTAMVEYSLDIDLPDYVFEDPIVIAMSHATTDIMTWPNVCGFPGLNEILC